MTARYEENMTPRHEHAQAELATYLVQGTECADTP
jgi:hypothetical protein